MNVIDKILNEWSFRCHDGIVDMNDPKKLAILNEILISEGIDDDIVDAVLNLSKEDPSSEEKKQKALAILTGTSETGILDAITPLDDAEKQKVLSFIKNKFKEEIKDHSELEKKIENKVGNANTADIISAFAVKTREDDDLLKYLSSDDQLPFDLGQKTGDLLTILRGIKNFNFNETFLSKIISFTPSEKGRSLGVGEIALELFFKNAKKASTGDIDIGGNLVELKGEAARFASKNSIATGREGGIVKVYEDLLKKFPEVTTQSSDFSTYIREILNSYNTEEDLKYINDILNKIYTNATSIEISLEDDRNEIYKKLIKKYLLGYTSAYKENNYYMLISDDSPFNYTLYTPEELVNNSDTLSFKNITTSSAFPNLLLGKDKEEQSKISASEKSSSPKITQEIQNLISNLKFEKKLGRIVIKAPDVNNEIAKKLQEKKFLKNSTLKFNNIEYYEVEDKYADILKQNNLVKE